jgi:hypothetical protein
VLDLVVSRAQRLAVADRGRPERERDAVVEDADHRGSGAGGVDAGLVARVDGDLDRLGRLVALGAQLKKLAGGVDEHPVPGRAGILGDGPGEVGRNRDPARELTGLVVEACRGGERHGQVDHRSGVAADRSAGVVHEDQRVARAVSLVVCAVA